jgi:hypothetical protein
MVEFEDLAPACLQPVNETEDAHLSPQPVLASVIVPRETGRVLVVKGLHRRTDSTRWVLARPPWHGRLFSVFLLAVNHLTRMADTIGYLL